MGLSIAGFNNPDPTSTQGTVYTVQDGDCLWNIAQAWVIAQAKAKGETPPTGHDLDVATANELQIIEDANPQIVGQNGSGTFDLIYAGDKIDIPNGQSGGPGVTAQQGARGFNAPDTPSTTQPGVWAGSTTLQAGQDVLSADGQYDLVMQSDGNLVLYKLKRPWHKSDGYADDTPVWASNTAGKPATQAVQSGGNIILYAADGKTVIATISESSLPQNLLPVVAGTPGGVEVGGNH